MASSRRPITASVRVDRVKAKFDQLQSATSKSVARESVANTVLRSTRQRFDPRGKNRNAQKSPDGTKWAALSPNTRRIARWIRTRDNTTARLPSGLRILNRTGSLRDSIDIISGDLERGLATNTGASVRIGIKPGARTIDGKSLVEIGRAHQFGARTKVFGRGSARIPARVFLGITDNDVKNIRRNIQRVLDKEIASPPATSGAGFQNTVNRILKK